jgi:hypothetical protein
MGRIPRWPRLAVGRGMNKGNCSSCDGGDTEGGIMVRGHKWEFSFVFVGVETTTTRKPS